MAWMLEKGSVVCSKAGRDKGSFLVVLQMDGNAVWVADGKERPLIRPKRKNIRHIAPTSTILPAEVFLTNRMLRKALRPFNDGDMQVDCAREENCDV